jgi:predicted esterase YcpF (UPF0227 family)
LAGLVIVWAVSVPAPGQAVEYGRDLKFTLYSGQGEAMPNRTYKVLNRAFGATHTVVGFNYDYVDVAANRAELQELYDRFLEGRNLIVVGTSLGGFWANYFANHVGARGAILINPVVDPQELMRVENPRTDMLVLLTKDDEVLRYQDAVRVFSAASRAKIEIFETGGHSPPLDRPDIMAAIRRFVEARSLP